MRYIFIIIFAIQCLSFVSMSAYCFCYDCKKLFSSLIINLLIAAFFLLVIFEVDLAEGIIVFMIHAVLIIFGLYCPVSIIHRCLMCIICRVRIKRMRELYSEINSYNRNYVLFLLDISPKVMHDEIYNQNSELLSEIQNEIDYVSFYEGKLNFFQRLKSCF